MCYAVKWLVSWEEKNSRELKGYSLVLLNHWEKKYHNNAGMYMSLLDTLSATSFKVADPHHMAHNHIWMALKSKDHHQQNKALTYI